MGNILGYIVLGAFWLLVSPLVILGYAANWINAGLYFGWDKASKHQAYMVKLSDDRKAKK